MNLFKFQIPKNKKSGTQNESLLEFDKALVLLFFLVSYSLVPKIEICLKYFFGQKFPIAGRVGVGDHLGMQIHT